MQNEALYFSLCRGRISRSFPSHAPPYPFPFCVLLIALTIRVMISCRCFVTSTHRLPLQPHTFFFLVPSYPALRGHRFFFYFYYYYYYYACCRQQDLFDKSDSCRILRESARTLSLRQDASLPTRVITRLLKIRGLRPKACILVLLRPDAKGSCRLPDDLLTAVRFQT